MSRIKLRGFASMDPKRRSEICSMGGKAAHAGGTANQFNSERASAAAKTGHTKGTAHEFTSEEARLAGRKGGLARAAQRIAAKALATAVLSATVAA